MSALLDALKGLLRQMNEYAQSDEKSLERAIATSKWAFEVRSILAEHEQSGWRPIESAPKDGSEVILLEGADSYAGYFSHAPNYWNEIGWYPSIDIAIEHSSHPDHPTHWQPLPKGPA